MKFYDVIIVGAGPAGLRCAEELAGTGQKVLVLEGKEHIGAKVCAGGLVRRSMDELLLPAGLPERTFDNFTVFAGAQRRTIRSDQTLLCTVNREKLGLWQLKRIDDENIEIRTQARVTKISGNQLIVNGGEELAFEYLVGADGSNSFVRKHLGLPVEKFQVAMQYLVKGQFEDIELHFDASLFGPFYAWVFPHQVGASIGCGTDNPYGVAKLKKNFCYWLNQKGIEVDGACFEAAIINIDYRGYRFGNFFLAGDAAGLASALTGEGIYEALVSGREIAREIIKGRAGPGLKELIARKRRHGRIALLFKYSGGLRKYLFRSIIQLLRHRILVKKLIDLM